MAKIIKKKKKKVALIKKNSDRKVAPPISSGLVSVTMLPNDLVILTNLMSICAKIFEEQAIIAASNNDEQKYVILTARHKITTEFANRFVEFCKMGEPQSRDMH